MPMNVNRWLKYAKAKLDDTVASGNDELDKLEARQEAERAERPWLASESDAPTFDEARARIAWEAELAAKAGDATTSSADDTDATSSPSSTAAPRADARPLPTDPRSTDEAAERSSAQIVLDQRAQESAARLDAIREELGVEDPDPPPA